MQIRNLLTPPDLFDFTSRIRKFVMSILDKDFQAVRGKLVKNTCFGIVDSLLLISSAKRSSILLFALGGLFSSIYASIFSRRLVVNNKTKRIPVGSSVPVSTIVITSVVVTIAASLVGISASALLFQLVPSWTADERRKWSLAIGIFGSFVVSSFLNIFEVRNGQLWSASNSIEKSEPRSVIDDVHNRSASLKVEQVIIGEEVPLHQYDNMVPTHMLLGSHDENRTNLDTTTTITATTVPSGSSSSSSPSTISLEQRIMRLKEKALRTARFEGNYGVVEADLDMEEIAAQAEYELWAEARQRVAAEDRHNAREDLSMETLESVLGVKSGMLVSVEEDIPDWAPKQVFHTSAQPISSKTVTSNVTAVHSEKSSREAAKDFGVYRKTMWRIDRSIQLHPIDGTDYGKQQRGEYFVEELEDDEDDKKAEPTDDEI